MLRAVRSLVVPIGFMLLAHIAQAAPIELLSSAGDGSDTATGLGGSYPLHVENPAVSADGRWIAFNSNAVNLAAGQRDRSAFPNVYLHDRQTGSTVLVSHTAGSATVSATGPSDRPPSISDDGRWIVYESGADDLVTGQAPSVPPQVFLYDRETGTNALVSHSTAGPAAVSNGWAGQVRISGDGSWISFESIATDLLPGQIDTQYTWDVFLHERATGQTRLVSRAAGTTLTAGSASSDRPSISQDGRWVAFRSQASNLIPGFTGTASPANVYLYDRVTGAMTLASHTSVSPTAGAGGWIPEISPDGAAVVYGSFATDLVPGQTDTAGTWDLFLFERASGTNVLVSHTDASPTTCGGASVLPGSFQASAGGDWVVFQDWDADFNSQVRLFRRADSSVTLVSRSIASPAQPADNRSLSPRLTPDGAFVVFESLATDLVAGQGGPATLNVFLFDRAAGTLALASGAGGSGQTGGNFFSTQPEVSDDGSVVAYYTWATDLVPGVTDLNGTLDLAVHDRTAAASSYATLHAPGQASSTPSTHSMLASASADGRYAVILSAAVNLVPGQVDTNSARDVFLVDRTAGTTTLVSQAAGLPTTTGNAGTGNAVISADGAFVVFTSRATNHVPGQVDTNFSPSPEEGPGVDVFLYDRAAGTTALVSRTAGSGVTAGDFECTHDVDLSADGRYVTFACYARNLVPGQVDTNFHPDVFLYDRVAGTTALVSRKAGTAAAVADNSSSQPVISDDGQWVGFLSDATDLVAGATDANGQGDLFLFDRTTGQTLLVSRAAGTAATTANQRSGGAALNPDGRYVVFSSFATNLVPGQNGPAHENVFLFDRVTGVVELISRTAGTATTTVTGANAPSVSDDGRYVVFLSTGASLLPGQTAGIGEAKLNVFVHDRVTRQTELISRSVLSPLRTSNHHAERPVLSPDGRYVGFASRATDLASGATGLDVYLADRQLQTLERVGRGSSGAYFYDLAPDIPRLSADGSVVLFTSADPGLTPADFNGADDAFAWVRSGPGAGDYFTVPPCRLIDTRQAIQGPALVDGVPAVVDVHGVCGIPSTARAVAINVTVLQAQGAGRLTLHPGNLSTPNTSTINFPAGLNLANNAILALASNGEGTLGITPFVIGGGTVHVVVDVSGYFQ